MTPSVGDPPAMEPSTAGTNMPIDHTNDPRTFSIQARDALENLGLENAQIQGLAAGASVAFNLAGAAEGTVAVARLLSYGRLQVGIYTIRNVGGGLADLATFEARAQAAARAVGVTELELMGLEVVNSHLRVVLERGGFTPTTLPAPDELGGGMLDAISRIEPINLPFGSENS